MRVCVSGMISKHCFGNFTTFLIIVVIFRRAFFPKKNIFCRFFENKRMIFVFSISIWPQMGVLGSHEWRQLFSDRHFAPPSSVQPLHNFDHVAVKWFALCYAFLCSLVATLSRLRSSHIPAKTANFGGTTQFIHTKCSLVVHALRTNTRAFWIRDCLVATRRH